MNITLNWDHVVDYASIDDIPRTYLEDNGGIYIWILKTAGNNRVFYIGETSAFFYRLLEHLTCQLSGRYTICDVPDEMDFPDFLKEYFHQKTTKEMLDKKKIYIPTRATNKNEFKFSDAFNDQIIDASRRMMSKMSFAFATIEGLDANEDSKTLSKRRKHIESALIYGMRKWYKDNTGGVPLTYKPNDGCRSDLIIGCISACPTERIVIKHAGNTSGIPVELLQITEHDPDKVQTK